MAEITGHLEVPFSFKVKKASSRLCGKTEFLVEIQPPFKPATVRFREGDIVQVVLPILVSGEPR